MAICLRVDNVVQRRNARRVRIEREGKGRVGGEHDLASLPSCGQAI
jgi:hypothetical protein